MPLLTDPVRHGIDGPAFDLVIPSLPGYGFSERPRRAGVNYRYVAALWHRLMTELEYERYGSGGGYNIQHWTEMSRGGHFAALEGPELLVEDIRLFFRALRS